MSNNTFGYIKKRILDIFGEYTDDSLFVLVSDTDRDALSKRIPDAVNSALIRMYESLPIGLEKGFFEPSKHIPITYAKSIPEAGAEFETDISQAAAVFFFSGKGSLVITNRDGEKCAEIVCDGSGKIEKGSEFVSLSGSGFCVKTTGFLSVRDFTLYEKKENTDINEYSPYGFMSVALPCGFSRFERVEIGKKEIDTQSVSFCEGYAYIPSVFDWERNGFFACYRKTAPVISPDTADDFIFDLSPLAIEALIYLSASELCGQADSQRYTRLVYKYTDLSAGLRQEPKSGRNTFFRKASGMRWK